MALLTMSGGLSRVIGPICISTVYQSLGLYYTIGGICVALVVALMLTIVAYPRMTPPPPPTPNLSRNRFKWDTR